MKKVCVFVCVLSCALLAACSSGYRKADPDLFAVQVIETIPQVPAPDWVAKTQEFWQEKTRYYYRGTAEGFTNLEAAKRAASANARISLAEQVKTIVREEFSRALEASAYEAATGGYLKDVFFSAVENLTLSGVAIRQSYVQRLLERNELSERVYYRAYVLASIEQKDFTRLVQAAFNDTKQQVAANKSAKDLAAVTEKRFWQQQQSIANAYE